MIIVLTCTLLSYREIRGVQPVNEGYPEWRKLTVVQNSANVDKSSKCSCCRSNVCVMILFNVFVLAYS